jgi:UPF0755 protein
MKKVLLFLTIILIIVLGSTVILINSNKITKNNKKVYFTVEKGASLNKISNQLKDKGIINSTLYFKVYAKVKGYEKKIKAGNYILKPNISLKELLNKFESPKSDYVIVAIPEGYTLYQIASKLESAGLVNKESFLNIKLSEVAIDKLITPGNKVFYELEGYLFPETYFIPYEASELEIAKMMYNQFEKVFTDEYRAQAKELNLSIDRVITIASLIEKEAANDEERKTISGVIYNRIRKGMRLQIDASVIYAITKGERTLDKVYNKDLAVKSAFNTYNTKGIPAGPIANPGKPSIEAALYPEENDYLYYVLGENGHVFSKTYEEHKKNIEKYMK